jgi:hypothetical protein
MDTIQNPYHNRQVRVRSGPRTLAILAKYTYEQTPSERAHARRIRAALCGSNDCTCGVVRETE